MNLDLSQLNYAVFDLETTGLYPDEGDEIIEIGAILVDKAEILERSYQSLVNPKRAIPAAATKVHGIRDEDVAKARTIEPVLDEFFEFVGPRIWVAQNARFDMGFIVRKMRELQRPMRINLVVDTMALSKMIFPYENSHSLDSIMARLGIVKSGDRHRSLDDSRYTAQALIEFIKLLGKQGISSLPQIENAFIKLDSLSKPPKARARNLFA